MKTILAGLAAVIVTGAAHAATFTSSNGFGGPSGYCNVNTSTGPFATGAVLGYTDQNCSGGFTVSLDTSTKTITLTNIVGSAFGDYDYGQLAIAGIIGLTITGLSTIQSDPLFNPNEYTFATVVPTPLLSFTGRSITIVFDSSALDVDGLHEFNYGSDGGQAIFAYTSTGTVPEPASWALLIAGFALTGVALRRRVARAA